MYTELQNSFLQLVRLGVGSSKEALSSNDIDWVQLKALADEQGLTAIVLDGMDRIQGLNGSQDSQVRMSDKVEASVQESLPLEMKLEWIGEVLQNYEQHYVVYEKAIGSLAKWHNQNGYKMMVLKGYACSLDWPKPNHRPCGDIDIWQFGQQKEADKELGSWFKDHGSRSVIDASHHHHTVFEWQGFTVENHYDFINVYHHRSHVTLEKVLKELGEDDTYLVEINGERVYLPSPNLHALFLLKHAALHFVGTELTFRQVLDWAFFVQKHGKDVDWKWLHGVLEEHGLMPFYQIINAICVGDLGFDAKIFPKNQHLPELKDRVIEEIFASVYQGSESSNMFVRQIKRFKRWKGNAWKHELCYKESMWSAFWSGVWGHLLKPSSI